MLPGDQDYVYVFGPEWGDDLLTALARDPEATRALEHNQMTLDDVRTYYLSPPHFQRVYASLVERGHDPIMSPAEVLIDLIAQEKIQMAGRMPQRSACRFRHTLQMLLCALR
ncbi:MAG: hypothetical protein NZM00_14215 [Anaerolinea sp.]|nr:hypothetical protein [Anaerolinea sp.]